MIYRLKLKEDAVADLKDAFNWYDSQREGLGSDFLDYVNVYFDKIISNPNGFVAFEGSLRAAFLQRFPFKIIYDVEHETILVYAVYHTSRNPKSRINQ